MKQTILNVLNDKSFSVLSSEHAKESIATEIVEKLMQKGVCTEKNSREKNWLQKKHEDKVFGNVESVEEPEGTPYTPEEIAAWNREAEGCSTQLPYDKYKEKLSEDIVDDKNKKYLYESPDGGQTIYRREFDKSEKEVVKDWQKKINERKAFIESADKGDQRFGTYKKFGQDLKSNDDGADQSIENNLEYYDKWKKENFNSDKQANFKGDCI
jgi:hypothetical protein